MQTSGSAAIEKLIQLVKAALSGKMDKSGGTFTGNVSGKYFTGTWLQTTAATDLGRVPGKIAVLDESGWVYYRTPAEIKSDIGASGGGVDVSTVLDKVYPVGSIYMSVEHGHVAIHAVDDDQRVIAAGKRGSAAHADIGGTHRVTTTLRDDHTADLALEGIGGTGDHSFVHVLTAHTLHGAGDGALRANGVTDDDDLIEILLVGFKNDVETLL